MIALYTKYYNARLQKCILHALKSAYYTQDCRKIQALDETLCLLYASGSIKWEKE